jgi:hypothetical protein
MRKSRIDPAHSLQPCNLLITEGDLQAREVLFELDERPYPLAACFDPRGTIGLM